MVVQLVIKLFSHSDNQEDCYGIHTSLPPPTVAYRTHQLLSTPTFIQNSSYLESLTARCDYPILKMKMYSLQKQLLCQPFLNGSEK